MKRAWRGAAVMVAAASLEFAARAVAGWRGVPMTPNAGVAFGLFRDMPEVAAGLSGVALGFLLWAPALLKKLDAGARTALRVMAGGAAANFITRLSCGAALDWIPLPFSELFTPSGLRFNLADVEIVLGGCLAAWHLNFKRMVD